MLFSWICSVGSFFLDYAQLGAFLDSAVGNMSGLSVFLVSASWLFVRALPVGIFLGSTQFAIFLDSAH